MTMVDGTSSEKTSEQTADVLVLGAGIAGLAAARAFAERGMRPWCLKHGTAWADESIRQQTSEGVVELGAEFVHGKDAQLWALIDEAERGDGRT